jgi:hypothetical protein
MIKRPALGQAASLGDCYDARTDTFISRNIFKSSPPREAISQTQIPSEIIRYTWLDTYKDKFHQFDINPELGASFLAGLLTVDGQPSTSPPAATLTSPLRLR